MVKNDAGDIVKSAEKFWGGKGKGISWEEADRKIFSWARRKFGDKYGRQIWRNDLLDLKALDISDTASVSYYQFVEHCEQVYEVIGKWTTDMLRTYTMVRGSGRLCGRWHRGRGSGRSSTVTLRRCWPVRPSVSSDRRGLLELLVCAITCLCDSEGA